MSRAMMLCVGLSLHEAARRSLSRVALLLFKFSQERACISSSSQQPQQSASSFVLAYSFDWLDLSELRFLISKPEDTS